VPTQIIFSNNGGEKAGNGDLNFVNHATYHPDGTYTISDPNPNPDPVPDPVPVNIPNKLYVLGNLEEAHWNTAIGVEMKKEGNSFIAYNIKFIPAANETNCFFNLTESLGDNWDDLNAKANRYGATANNTPLQLNQSLVMKKYDAGSSASQCQSWMVAPGAYNLIADFENNKITLASPTISGIDYLTDDCDANAVYFTLQGIKVDNPSHGIFIKVSGIKTEKVVIR
ncbi:MAG: hypothetical protein K2J15_01960, partial [Muribaculaceae bacterium]|nr:hypothetical protein [Muribaculaceae bacterium]